jgi:hypothetical protein
VFQRLSNVLCTDISYWCGSTFSVPLHPRWTRVVKFVLLHSYTKAVTKTRRFVTKTIHPVFKKRCPVTKIRRPVTKTRSPVIKTRRSVTKNHCVLYSFVWVNPWRLDFICRRFGTLQPIFMCGVSTIYED